jgi:hypothetical protein
VKRHPDAGLIGEDHARVVAQIRPIVRVLDFMPDVSGGVETKPNADTMAVEKQNIGRFPIGGWRPQLMIR